MVKCFNHALLAVPLLVGGSVWFKQNLVCFQKAVTDRKIQGFSLKTETSGVVIGRQYWSLFIWCASGGSDQVWVHEIRHVSTHLNAGGLRFSASGKLGTLDPSGIQDEITGYRAQFAFKKESLPESIDQYEHSYKPDELEDINIKYLGRINKINTYQPVYQAISDSLDRKNATKKE